MVFFAFLIASNRAIYPVTWTITSLEKVFSATKNYCFYYGDSSLATLICCPCDGDKPLINAGESYVRKPIFSRESGNITHL